MVSIADLQFVIVFMEANKGAVYISDAARANEHRANHEKISLGNSAHKKDALITVSTVVAILEINYPAQAGILKIPR
jgi:hypothetical protein